VKKLRAADIRRLNEKLIENEKLVDKDDTSSTTTETSSIEADDKVQLWFLLHYKCEITIFCLILIFLLFLHLCGLASELLLIMSW